MRIFRKALLIIIILSVSVLAGAGFSMKVFGAVFPDIKEDILYYPHIKRLTEQYFVTGDTNSGNFIPYDIITRAEFARMVVYTRLAEKYGIKDNWLKKDNFGMAFELFDLLNPYFGCGDGACANIGGVPFTDVPESNPKCMDNLDDPKGCKPWFSRYIYYMVAKGFVKGYRNTDGTQSFHPEENMSRVNAIKMIITDNGNLLPENESRYIALRSRAEKLNSYTPKCLKGAENFIKDLNGGNTLQTEKLLKYVLLADRLDLFGNKCQVFGDLVTPQDRANFLQRPLTREETPRYFAITTDYRLIRPDADDTTINTASQNNNSPASDPSYKIPPYERTPLYDKNGGDESIWGKGDGTVTTAPVINPVKTPVAQIPVKKPVSITDTQKTDISRPGTELPAVTITASVDISLADEYGQTCGTIPAGTAVNLLMAKKGEEGKFWQYTDYDKSRLCRFPCDKLMTPACREAMNEDISRGAILPSDIVAMNTNIVDINILKNFFVPQKYLETLKNIKAVSVPKIPTEKYEERLFKTSIAHVNIFEETKNNAYVVKTIPDIKTEIIVIGKAVIGEFSDDYKTDRWYPVKCKECKNNRGYVLATLIHPDFIDFKDKASDCGNRNQIKGLPIDRVVLHGTVGSSVSSALNAFKDCTGAHFYVGRDGAIVQIATVDKLIWHAGYGGNKGRTQLVNNTKKNSYTSIGVEIVSLGLFKDQNDKTNKDIDTVFQDYWNMWKEGLHWGGFKDSKENPIDIDSKKWQFYTEDQYKALDKLLSYIEESTGIPYRVSLYKNENDKNNSLAYYFTPNYPADLPSKNPQNSVITKYFENLFSFKGVVDHHTNAGKWDTGPAFDICNKNLNFTNIENLCKKTKK
jgi:hypothetical protein